MEQVQKVKKAKVLINIDADIRLILKLKCLSISAYINSLLRREFQNEIQQLQSNDTQ